MTMIKINEESAKRAKENMSHSDYETGRATREYNEHIEEIKEVAEKAKSKCNKEESKERIDRLVERYTVNYANWINKYNANGAGHVSVMVAGPSNYNMGAHEKYLSREGKLWEEYNELKGIENKIWAVVAGDKIIKSDDVDAIEQLQVKVEKLEESQELMKAANKIVKSKKMLDSEKVVELVKLGLTETSALKLLSPDFCGRYGFASCSLTNNNATIRAAKQRIAHLQKIAEQAATTPAEDLTTEINGIQIIDNLEAQRLQIIFPGKPDADTRTELKKNGFRWAPSNGAWQSYRSPQAQKKAEDIISKIK